jgi:phage baseplate assembly protein W
LIDKEQAVVDSTSKELAHLSVKLGVLHEDVSEMKVVLRDLASAITKLAVIEQQQAYSAQAQERAFTALEKLEARISVVEHKLPDVARTSVWVDRAVWGGAAAAVVYVAKKVGLL